MIKKKKILILVAGVVVILLSSISLTYLNIKKKLDEGSLGLEAVNYLYSFNSISELDDNMDKLREITSEEMYNFLTLDRTDRALSIYLKFKKKPTKAIIEFMSEGVVVYSLLNEEISPSRKFVFVYKIENGKITEVREGEFIDFFN